MKAKRKELNVDFIGSQEPLTKEEENALSDFFKKKKEQNAHRVIRKKTTKRTRVNP